MGHFGRPLVLCSWQASTVLYSSQNLDVSLLHNNVWNFPIQQFRKICRHFIFVIKILYVQPQLGISVICVSWGEWYNLSHIGFSPERWDQMIHNLPHWHYLVNNLICLYVSVLSPGAMRETTSQHVGILQSPLTATGAGSFHKRCRMTWSAHPARSFLHHHPHLPCLIPTLFP